MLIEILDILQVATTEFFSPIIKEEKLLFEMISALSSENKQTILDLIKQLR